MEFGKIEQVSLLSTNTFLPKYSDATVSVLQSHQLDSKGVVRIGTGQWGRKDWIGTLYPEKTNEKVFLQEYVKHFNCIELNSTFYQIYSSEKIEGWANDTPEGFLFCPKFIQSVTHFRRLKNCDDRTSEFIDEIRCLGKRLGPTFLQMPDNFAPNKFKDLETYLISLPKDIQFFVEVRHQDWFTEENKNMLFDLLSQNGIGWVITDTSGRRDVLHMELPIPKAYIRFVGNFHPTDAQRIDAWAERINQWLEAGIQEVYFIVHVIDESKTPYVAEYTAKKFNEVCGLIIPIPKLINPFPEQDLFSK